MGTLREYYASIKMIETLENDITKYVVSDYLKNFLHEKVNLPFENKSLVTSSWRREILNPYKDRDYARIKDMRDIIEGGQADFDKEFKGITPKEKVLLYCYRNFEQHLVSQMYIFESHADILKQYVSNDDPAVFIDYGCGPMTSGIALARCYAEFISTNGDPLKINYIGIDSSETMCEKADDFRKYPNLFHEDSKFEFIKEVYLPECLDKYISEKSTIFFNFSYFFASPTLVVEDLVLRIQHLSEKYPNQMVILFQNPDSNDGRINGKWDHFKKSLTNFKSSLSGGSGGKKELICYMKNTEIPSRTPRDTHLYYDIRCKSEICMNN